MSGQVLALALCRVSTTEQLENNSLNRQRQNVLERANELEVEILEDDWWSGSVSSKRGTNITRKDLQEMLERCKWDKRIKYIIVDEVDRFMRSMLEIGYYLVEFKKLGVTVVFASQPNLKTDNAANTLMLMLEAFKAEGSNEERQYKSIDGATTALKQGRYTFAPKPGYMKGTVAGIQEVHPVRGPALQKVLKDVVHKRVTPTQGLINLNNSEFMATGHSQYKMDKFRKIVTDPFYAGVVEINKQVKVRNENGLHEPLITLEEHKELVRIMEAKKKNQKGPRKNGNPRYPVSNFVTCELCVGKRYPRLVGYKHSNGKNENLVYEKYRCRSCARYLTRDEMHPEIERQFTENPMTQDGNAAVIEALRVVWRRNESQTAQDINRIAGNIEALNSSIDNQVDKLSDDKYLGIHDEILKSIEKKKQAIKELEGRLFELKQVAKNDEAEFLQFAYDFIESTGKHFLDAELVSKENRERCKNLIFPAGFYLDANKKVYTPEISPLYRLATNKKDAEASEKSHLVRVRRL